jgi:hypothetical protein
VIGHWLHFRGQTRPWLMLLRKRRLGILCTRILERRSVINPISMLHRVLPRFYFKTCDASFA